MSDPQDHSSHPGPAEYVQIGAILAVATGIEVALYYADAGPITIPALLFLTLIKFSLVVFWFMHLRFDSRLFRRLFFVGVVAALVLYTATVSTFYFGP